MMRAIILAIVLLLTLASTGCGTPKMLTGQAFLDKLGEESISY
jgi:hypothetical protein